MQKPTDCPVCAAIRAITLGRKKRCRWCDPALWHMEATPVRKTLRRDAPARAAETGERLLQRGGKNLPPKLSDGLRFLLLDAMRQEMRLVDFRDSVHGLFRMAGEKPPSDSSIRSWMTGLKADAERRTPKREQAST